MNGIPENIARVRANIARIEDECNIGPNECNILWYSMK